MTNIYALCEIALASFSATNAIPYGAIDYDPGIGALPDRFFIYRLISDVDVTHFNNLPKRVDYRIEVRFHTRIKADMLTWPDKFDTAMLAAGYRLQGNGRDIEKTETGHYGWSKDYKIAQKRS